MTFPSNADEHDAQRELQQRCLRNVRALLDKLENEAQLERITRRRIAIGLVVTGAVALGGGYLALKSRGLDRSVVREVVSAPVQRTAPAPEPARTP
jgi:hypothetical protein